jgi:phosphoserine phosphatase
MNTAYCFGLDGIMTAQDTLPLLGAELGYEDELRVLADAARTGRLLYDKAFGLCGRLLADLPVARIQALLQQLPLFPGVLKFMQSCPRQCYLVTDHPEPWIEGLVRPLGINCHAARVVTDATRTLAVPVGLDKGRILSELRTRHDRIVAVGHGMGEVPLFEAADIGVAFGGLHHPVETIIQLSDLVCFSETALCQTLATL